MFGKLNTVTSQTGHTIDHKHPAMFPEKLAHDHIISWSKEGDTVLDPLWEVAQQERWQSS